MPVNAVPDFITEATAAVEAMIPGCRPVPFGHLGDGNIHYNVTQPIGADRATFLARWDEVNDAVFAIVAKFGAKVSLWNAFTSAAVNFSTISFFPSTGRPEGCSP